MNVLCQRMKAEAEELDETHAEWANPHRLRDSLLGAPSLRGMGFRG